MICMGMYGNGAAIGMEIIQVVSYLIQQDQFPARIGYCEVVAGILAVEVAARPLAALWTHHAIITILAFGWSVQINSGILPNL